MLRLSENERAIVQVISGFLLLAGAGDLIPIELPAPYSEYLRIAVGVAGALGLGLQKVLAESKVRELSVYERVNRVFDDFMRLEKADMWPTIKTCQTIAATFGQQPSPPPAQPA